MRVYKSGIHITEIDRKIEQQPLMRKEKSVNAVTILPQLTILGDFNAEIRKKTRDSENKL